MLLGFCYNAIAKAVIGVTAVARSSYAEDVSVRALLGQPT
jgi:hypothetical protein